MPFTALPSASHRGSQVFLTFYEINEAVDTLKLVATPQASPPLAPPRPSLKIPPCTLSGYFPRLR